MAEGLGFRVLVGLRSGVWDRGFRTSLVSWA